jgi:hypothetical protein
MINLPIVTVRLLSVALDLGKEKGLGSMTRLNVTRTKKERGIELSTDIVSSVLLAEGLLQAVRLVVPPPPKSLMKLDVRTKLPLPLPWRTC